MPSMAMPTLQQLSATHTGLSEPDLLTLRSLWVQVYAATFTGLYANVSAAIFPCIIGDAEAAEIAAQCRAVANHAVSCV